MIVLRKMKNEELNDYLDYFVPDYADEIVRNFHYSKDEAIVQAVSEVNNDLPQGVDTSGQFLFCVELSDNPDSTVVGYLWFRLSNAGKIAFVNDLFIFSKFRGKGFGKQTLSALEVEVLKLDIDQIELRVAYDNKRAQGLYEGMGFFPTGVNMFRKIDR